MSTEIDNFKTRVNTEYRERNDRGIRGVDLNTDFSTIISLFANKDEPVICYPLTLANDQLTDLSFVLTHGLGTNVPDILAFDEDMNEIDADYFQYQSTDEDSGTIDFFDTIPETGAGCYTFLFWRVAPSVTMPLPPNEALVFYDEFINWTDGLPDGWIANNPDETCTIENTDNTLHVTTPGNQFAMVPPVTLDAGVNYIVTAKIDSPKFLVFISGYTAPVLASGIVRFAFRLNAPSPLAIRSYNNSSFKIDWLKIEIDRNKVVL